MSIESGYIVYRLVALGILLLTGIMLYISLRKRLRKHQPKKEAKAKKITANESILWLAFACFAIVLTIFIVTRTSKLQMAQDTTNQMQPVCHALSQPERVYLTKKPREQKEASTVELNKRIMFFQRVHENVVSGYIMVAGNLLDEYRSSHKLSLEETYQTYEDMNGLTAGSYTDFMHSLNANHISGFYKKMSFANASIDEYLQTRSDREIAFILDANRDMKINMLDYEIIERNLIASGQQSTIMRAIIMDRLKAYEQKFNDQIQELLCPQSVVNQPADIEPSEVEQ